MTRNRSQSLYGAAILLAVCLAAPAIARGQHGGQTSDGQTTQAGAAQPGAAQSRERSSVQPKSPSGG